MLKLTDREWKAFLFPEIFVIKGGYYNKKPSDLRENGDIPFYGATRLNNGVTSWHRREQISTATKDGSDKNHPIERKIFHGNSIVVTNNGSVGYAYYAKHPFTCSHDVNPLYLRENIQLDRSLAMFLITQIECQRMCFEYARKWRPERMRTSRILLPVKYDGAPDWEFMSDYMREQEKLMLEKVLPHFQKRLLDNLLTLGATPDSEWGGVKLADIFTITIGRNLDRNKIDKNNGDIPYVTRKETNNGIDGFTSGHDNDYLWNNVPAITIGNETAKPFVQTTPFYTGTKVNILAPKRPMSKGVLSFIARCLEANRERYSYSYSANSSRLAEQSIMLPIGDDGELNLAFMEQTIARIEADEVKYVIELLQNRYDELTNAIILRGGVLTDRIWKAFSVGDILSNIYRGMNDSLDSIGDGEDLSYVGATYRNNGVTGFVNKTDATVVESSNCIVFVMTGEGSVGLSFYKKEPFIPSKNVSIGRSEYLNPHSGNFLVRMINSQSSRYNYGYIRSMERLKKERVLLPVNTSKEPDWKFMTTYMCSQESLALLNQLHVFMGGE